MGRIKLKTLKKKGGEDVLFPKTLAKQVVFSDGENLEEKMKKLMPETETEGEE